MFRVEFYLENDKLLTSCILSNYNDAFFRFKTWLIVNPKIKKAFFYEGETLVLSTVRE